METTPKKKIKPMVRLTKDQIRQKQAQIQQYIESANASTGSLVDSNANVTTKTVSTLGAELQKDFSIQINRQTVADYIEKYFDKELADDYIDMLESLSIKESQIRDSQIRNHGQGQKAQRHHRMHFLWDIEFSMRRFD